MSDIFNKTFNNQKALNSEFTPPPKMEPPELEKKINFTQKFYSWMIFNLTIIGGVGFFLTPFLIDNFMGFYFLYIFDSLLMSIIIVLQIGLMISFALKDEKKTNRSLLKFFSLYSLLLGTFLPFLFSFDGKRFDIFFLIYASFWAPFIHSQLSLIEEKYHKNFYMKALLSFTTILIVGCVYYILFIEGLVFGAIFFILVILKKILATYDIKKTNNVSILTMKSAIILQLFTIGSLFFIATLARKNFGIFFWLSEIFSEIFK